MQNQGSFDDESLRKLMCCKCGQFLNVPPIMLLHDGNGSCICGRCYREEDYTDADRPTRNKMYETIAPLVPFPCKYKKAGCKEQRKGQTLFLHESLCSFQPFSCPTCDWKGQIQTLQQHYISDHNNLYLTDNKITIATNTSYEETKFIVDKEMQFLLYIKCDLESRNLWFDGVCLTSPSCGAMYNLELDFKLLESTNSSVIFKTETLNIFQPIVGTLKININTLNSLLNNDVLQAQISFSQTGSNTSLTNSSLLKEFECRVCNNYFFPPISMCTSGHSICSFCKSQVDKCPICRANFLFLHNYTLESIIEQMSYPCKYFANGCRYISQSSEIKLHESICELKTDE